MTASPATKSRFAKQRERLTADGKFSFVAVDHIETPDNRLRRLRPQTVDDLAGSISRCGLLHPIVVSRLSDGALNLIAGRHRLEAVKKLGHHNIRVVILDQLHADEAQLTEIDENLVRAELSPAERAMHQARRKELYERLYPEAKHGGDRKSEKIKSTRQNGDLKSRFTKDTANKTSRSERTIQREIERASKIPNLIDVIGTSLDTADNLDWLAKLPEAKQWDLIESAKAGKKIKASVAVMKDRYIRREQELTTATEAASRKLGKKLYGVIYADPPWRYDIVPMGDVARRPEQHYRTMPLEEIKALPIPAADDCALFLWAVVPLLPEAFEVMKAWGFTYKTASTWLKDREGLGYWVRGIAEHLLIGVRGNVLSPPPGEQFPGAIEAPRTRHSEKPDILAEHIGRLYPNTPKLEMFARKARPGWDVWGNEAPAAEPLRSALNGGAA